MKLFKSRYDGAESRALVGNKRSVRLSISINNEYDRKLTLLSNSCGMSKSEMTDQLLRIALDSPNVVDWLQEQYNKVEEYRIRLVPANSKR